MKLNRQPKCGALPGEITIWHDAVLELFPRHAADWVQLQSICVFYKLHSLMKAWWKNMPPMTMGYSVKSKEQPSDLQPMQKVDFQVIYDGSDYLITEIK